MKPAVLVATHFGKIPLGDAVLPCHVLRGGMPVVETTSIECMIGLPESGLGSFLASLPGTDRVRFRVQGETAERVGVPADKVVDLLQAYWQANPETEAGIKAREILRMLMRHGLRKMGQDPAMADTIMSIVKGRGR